MGEYRLDPSISRVAGSCEYGNKISSSLKCREFLEQWIKILDSVLHKVSYAVV